MSNGSNRVISLEPEMDRTISRGVVSDVVLFGNRFTASVLLVQFTLHTLAEWRDENPEPCHPCHVAVTEPH